jgi:hypothetical protein
VEPQTRTEVQSKVAFSRVLLLRYTAVLLAATLSTELVASRRQSHQEGSSRGGGTT